MDTTVRDKIERLNLMLSKHQVEAQKEIRSRGIKKFLTRFFSPKQNPIFKCQCIRCIAPQENNNIKLKENKNDRY